MYKLSPNSESNLQGVKTELIEVISLALTLSPIDFGIPKLGGYRSANEQKILFVKGKSKCDGFKIKSNHQTGEAFDFFAYVDGKASWDPIHLAQIWGAIHAASIRLGIELEWGGNWKSFTDMPHVQKKAK